MFPFLAGGGGGGGMGDWSETQCDFTKIKQSALGFFLVSIDRFRWTFHHKCFILHTTTLRFTPFLKNTFKWRGFSSLRDFGIKECSWETAHLPLPKPDISPKARSRC